jgi:hypothetical protein
MPKRKPFNVSRIVDRMAREESGPALVSGRWGVFEDPSGKLVSTWPKKSQALEAARQLNAESAEANVRFGTSE